MGFELIIFLIISIVLIILTIYLKLRDDQIIDQARKNLFSIRFEMTSYAIEKGIQDSHAFVLLRKRINNSIRFSHKMNVLNIFWGMYFQRDKKIKKEINNLVQKNAQVLKSFNGKDRDFFNSKIEEMKNELFYVMIKRSILISTLTGLFYTIYLIRNTIKALWSILCHLSAGSIKRIHFFIGIDAFQRELELRYEKKAKELGVPEPLSFNSNKYMKVAEYEASACRA